MACLRVSSSAKGGYFLASVQLGSRFSWSPSCRAKGLGLGTPPALLISVQCRRAYRSVFCFGTVHIRVENLVLQNLSAQCTFEIQLTPLEQLGRGQSMLPRNVRHAASSLIGLIDDLKLLFRPPALSALNNGEHQPGRVV